MLIRSHRMIQESSKPLFLFSLSLSQLRDLEALEA
jgi:hypothetical protein